MKKRVLAIFLTIAMVSGICAGCTTSADSGATSENDKKTAAANELDATSEESTENGENTDNEGNTENVETASDMNTQDSGEIYMFISQPEYADAMNELIDAYKEVAPNVTINYETTQNDYPTLLKAKINSGDVPDIFSSTSGKEIDVYREYSYDLSGQALMDTMDPSVAETMKSSKLGSGCYGFAIKSSYTGIVYNKAIFEECGISEFPATPEAMEKACELIADKGYKPFSTGFAEWWVYKHIWHHYFDAAAQNAGITAAELTAKFETGEASLADYPELYDNFFQFIDLAAAYGDDKPLETDLSGELAALGNGSAAMVLGQGPWIEDDLRAIDPELLIGFNGYPVSDKPEQCQITAGADQALHVYNDSQNLQAVLNFVNWWYTSDYGKAWFTDVAGVLPPINSDTKTDYAIIEQGKELAQKNGAAEMAICYSTDSWWQTFGQLLQAYVAGEESKESICAEIEKQWQAIDGVSIE